MLSLHTHTWNKLNMSALYRLIYVLVVATCGRVQSTNELVQCEACEAEPQGQWSALLEDWVTANVSAAHCGRHGRIMAVPTNPDYYVSERADGPPHGPYQPHGPHSPRPYAEWGPPPPPPPPGKILNRPPNPYKDKFKPSYPAPPPPPFAPPNSVERIDESQHGQHPHKMVSETDLYLLSAIEKLVYRVDFMEKRLRKLEESVHYMLAGPSTPAPAKPATPSTTPGPAAQPCASGLTRVGAACYHFSTGTRDWKSAHSACTKLRARLIELDLNKQRTLFTYLRADNELAYTAEWWTGGLNPGLLWIWSHSGRPVSNITEPGAHNSTGHVLVAGEGRCLALVHDSAVAPTYAYRGQDCALKHRFICEKMEDEMKLSNEIQRVAKALGPLSLAVRSRQARHMDETTIMKETKS